MNAIIQTLDSLDIHYKLYHHEAVFTVEQANKIEHQIPAIHMKNLFLKDKADNFHLVCIGAHHRLKIKDFGRAHDIKDLSFGSPDDLMTQLHVTPGSVSIFGIMYQTNTSLYIDPAIIDQPAIGRHPNDNTMTLVLSYQELLKFLRMVGVSPIIVKDWLN